MILILRFGQTWDESKRLSRWSIFIRSRRQLTGSYMRTSSNLDKQLNLLHYSGRLLTSLKNSSSGIHPKNHQALAHSKFQCPLIAFCSCSVRHHAENTLWLVTGQAHPETSYCSVPVVNLSTVSPEASMWSWIPWATTERASTFRNFRLYRYSLWPHGVKSLVESSKPSQLLGISLSSHL